MTSEADWPDANTLAAALEWAGYEYGTHNARLLRRVLAERLSQYLQTRAQRPVPDRKINIPSKENPDDRPQPPQRMNSEERSNEEIRALCDAADRVCQRDYAEDDVDAGAIRDLAEAARSLLARIAAVDARVAAALAEFDHTGPNTKWCRSLILHGGSCNCWRAALAASPTPTGPEPATDPIARLPEHLRYISRTVTASYPAGMDDELVMRRRVCKVFVEAGELGDAIEGYTGENPRKGNYATADDVIKELIDCASASLCAVEFMTGDEGKALGMLAAQVAGNAQRLSESIPDTCEESQRRPELWSSQPGWPGYDGPGPATPTGPNKETP